MVLFAEQKTHPPRRPVQRDDAGSLNPGGCTERFANVVLEAAKHGGFFGEVKTCLNIYSNNQVFTALGCFP